MNALHDLVAHTGCFDKAPLGWARSSGRFWDICLKISLSQRINLIRDSQKSVWPDHVSPPKIIGPVQIAQTDLVVISDIVSSPYRRSDISLSGRIIGSSKNTGNAQIIGVADI